MTYPTGPKTDYVKEGLSRLLWQYRDKDVLEAVLTALLNRWQELENATWEVILYRALPLAEGAQLDMWARFVDIYRFGRDDDALRRAISIEFMILRSNGRMNTLAKIASLVFSPRIAVETLAQGLFRIELFDAPPPYDVVNGFLQLIRAKAGGVRLHVEYAPQPAAFTFTFAPYGGGNNSKLGWGYDPPVTNVGGKWATMLSSEGPPSMKPV